MLAEVGVLMHKLKADKLDSCASLNGAVDIGACCCTVRYAAMCQVVVDKVYPTISA